MSFSESESDDENGYEVCRSCPCGPNSCALPFDPTNIENIILSISDTFDLRVILNNDRARGAVLVTTGLTIAGGLIGRHYGGKIGAAVGGAIGGVCGAGIVAVSMRDIWQDIKSKLSDLFELVYDYLSGLGLNDYKRAAMYLTSHSGDSQELAMVIMDTASSILGKQIQSKFTAICSSS